MDIASIIPLTVLIKIYSIMDINSICDHVNLTQQAYRTEKMIIINVCLVDDGTEEMEIYYHRLKARKFTKTENSSIDVYRIIED